MITHRQILLAVMFLGAAISVLAADDDRDLQAGGFAAVFKVVDLNRDGLVDSLEWQKFEALRLLAEKNHIDTTRSLSVAKIASALETVNREISRLSSEQETNALPIQTLPITNAGRSRGQRLRLPMDLLSYDRNCDGQISLAEWPKGLRRDFTKFDRNNDGFIEPREAQ